MDHLRPPDASHQEVTKKLKIGYVEIMEIWRRRHGDILM